MSRTVEHVYASYYNIRTLGGWRRMVAMSDIPEWLRGIAPWRVAVTFHRRCFEKINEKYDCKVHYNIVDCNAMDDRAKEYYDIVLSRKAY